MEDKGLLERIADWLEDTGRFTRIGLGLLLSAAGILSIAVVTSGGDIVIVEPALLFWIGVFATLGGIILLEKGIRGSRR